MHVDRLGAGDPAWTAFLGEVDHDFYHLPTYVDLCALREGGEAAAFLAADDLGGLLVPLILRPIPGTDQRDAGSPYGYPCPLLSGPPEPARLEALLGAFAEACGREGLVSAFLRLHPLLPLPAIPWARFGTLVDHGWTIYLDLTQPPEVLDRQTRANHRTGARRLLERGFRVVLDAWDRLDAFAALYLATMTQRDAGPAYRFGLDYFQELHLRLEGRMHLALVLDPADTVAAGGLFSRVEGLMQFHLAGTDPAFRALGPSKLMILHMRDQGRAWGARALHLGGGVGCAEDSLALFKRGFSPLEARFQTFRMVLLPEAYRALGGAAPGDGFFPAYRSPGGVHA